MLWHVRILACGAAFVLPVALAATSAHWCLLCQFCVGCWCTPDQATQALCFGSAGNTVASLCCRCVVVEVQEKGGGDVCIPATAAGHVGIKLRGVQGSCCLPSVGPARVETAWRCSSDYMGGVFVWDVCVSGAGVLFVWVVGLLPASTSGRHGCEQSTLGKRVGREVECTQRGLHGWEPVASHPVLCARATTSRSLLRGAQRCAGCCCRRGCQVGKKVPSSKGRMFCLVSVLLSWWMGVCALSF